MIIETKNSLYDIEFGQVQIEITGKCNMNCMHCRNSFDLKEHMPLSQMEKIFQLVSNNSTEDVEIVISGGEPFLHPEFEGIIDMLIFYKFRNLFITTNGSVLDISTLKHLKHIPNVMISISLDSKNSIKHDNFRNYKGAFNNAIDLIKHLKALDYKVSIRNSLTPENFNEIEEFTSFCISLNVDRIAFSTIFPIGEAVNNSHLFFNKNTHEIALRKIFELRDKHLSENVKITTNDPLQLLCRGNNDCFEEENSNNNTYVIDGCSAGVAAFNVHANGNLTPCAMLNVPISNVFTKTVMEIENDYKSNTYIKSLLERNLEGKCGFCNLKYKCGGCRARAYYASGNNLGSDPFCSLD